MYEQRDYKQICIHELTTDKMESFNLFPNSSLNELRQIIGNQMIKNDFYFLFQQNIIERDNQVHIPFQQIVRDQFIITIGLIQNDQKEMINHQKKDCKKSHVHEKNHPSIDSLSSYFGKCNLLEKTSKILEQIQIQTLCPITLQPLINPTIASDGHSYQKDSIQKWCLTSTKSPISNAPFSHTHRIPNITLRNLQGLVSDLSKNIDKQIKYFREKLQYLLEKEIKSLRDKFGLLVQEMINDNVQNIEKLKNLEEQVLKNSSNKWQLSSELSSRIQSVLSSNYQNINHLEQIKSGCHISNPKHLQIQNKHLFRQPQLEYLLQNFLFEDQMARRFKTRYQEYTSLDHSKSKIQMKKFVDQDWSNLEKLQLNDSHMGDIAWRIFVQNAQKLKNLRVIELDENQISDISEEDLQKFKRLKAISIKQNPLNMRTVKTLQMLNKKRIYQIKFSSKEQREYEMEQIMPQQKIVPEYIHSQNDIMGQKAQSQYEQYELEQRQYYQQNEDIQFSLQVGQYRKKQLYSFL